MARDDFDEADYDDDRPRRRRGDSDNRQDAFEDLQRGRAKAAGSGSPLAVVAGLALVVSMLVFALSLASPGTLNDPPIDFSIGRLKSQPPSPRGDAEIRRLELKKVEGRKVNPARSAGAALGVACNLLAVVGGLRMKEVADYGLAMTGAVAAVIPCSGCCCLTVPVGVWALLVLLDPDVKAAFAATRSHAFSSEN